MLSAAHMKADVLSNRVALSPDFAEHYGRPYLEKRRAYGNSDPLSFRNKIIPQEFYLLPERVVVAANISQNAPWTLHWDEDFCLIGENGSRTPITFPKRPAFYDYKLRDGTSVSRVITLYGGGSLGLFVYSRCALPDMGKACKYCSIEPNHKETVDFETVIRPEQVEEAVELALTDLEAPIGQVMLNGGNFPNLDRSFLYYVSVVKAARRAINRSGRDVELHLIVFPPRDLELFAELKGEGVSIAINTEVFSPKLFEEYCPGKSETAGQNHIMNSMKRAAEILGPGKVHSIIVGGLEASGNIATPMRKLADQGVTPIVNVFHADPETPLANHPSPSSQEIVAMGRQLQDIYGTSSDMRPFYMNCGRNSIDTEAFFQMW